MNKDRLLITHANCNDGFAAYYVYNQFYPDSDVLFLDYDPAEISNLSPVLIKRARDKHVMVADFSFENQELLHSLIDVSSSFVMLDHHEGALKSMRNGALFHETEHVSTWAVDIKDKDHVEPYGKLHRFVAPSLDPKKYKIYFHETCCGSKLLYHYLTNSHTSASVPTLLKYIDGNDRFDFAGLKEPRSVAAYISSFPRELESWAHIDKELNANLDSCIAEGGVINRAKKQEVANIIASGYHLPITWLGRSGLIINAPPHLATMLGTELAKHAPDGYAAVWHAVNEHTAKVSLRSHGEHVCLDIAQHFGGNGHTRACGFYLPLAELVEELSRISI